MDAEQLKLLAMAERETDPNRLMELIDQVLHRFDVNDDPHQLCEALAMRRAS